MHPTRHLVALVWLLTALQPEAVASTNKSPQMQIVGNYRYLHHGIFQLYDATLLAPSGVEATRILSAQHPFELHFHFLRSIKKEYCYQVSQPHVKEKPAARPDDYN